MGLKQFLILFFSPVVVVDLGVQMIVPPLLGKTYLSRHCLPVLSNVVPIESF